MRKGQLGASPVWVGPYAPMYAPMCPHVPPDVKEFCWVPLDVKSKKKPAVSGLWDVHGPHWTLMWWRRRVSNPRPQALHYGVYMLIPSLISLTATRRAGKTISQSSKNLTDQTLDMSSPRSCVGDPCYPAAQARAGQRALGWFLSS